MKLQSSIVLRLPRSDARATLQLLLHKVGQFPSKVIPAILMPSPIPTTICVSPMDALRELSLIVVDSAPLPSRLQPGGRFGCPEQPLVRYVPGRSRMTDPALHRGRILSNFAGEEASKGSSRDPFPGRPSFLVDKQITLYPTWTSRLDSCKLLYRKNRSFPKKLEVI